MSFDSERSSPCMEGFGSGGGSRCRNWLHICKFDLPYLVERAETLKVNEFPILGRTRNSYLQIRDILFSSRQYGIRESKEVTIEGHVQFDLLQITQVYGFYDQCL
jgi:DNA polymerase elongation subunit (family B)